MRVYVPDKRDNVVNEALRDLYTLRQSISYGTGSTDSKLDMIDKIRSKLKTILDE